MPKETPNEKTTELIDDAALASILGSLLWLSLRTRPDISWAVSRLDSLASTEPDETRRRLKQLMSYLRWTLDFALVFTGSKEETSLEVYTDASWSPTGEKSHSGLCVYYRGNLVAWNSKRQSLVALSSAEAELIAC
eukprot:6468545-Amphidinium_carterae.1